MSGEWPEEWSGKVGPRLERLAALLAANGEGGLAESARHLSVMSDSYSE